MIVSIVLTLLASCYAGQTRYMAPLPGKTGDPAMLIFLQGAYIENRRYMALCREIQLSVSFPLHVVLPDFIFDVAAPIPAYVHSIVTNAEKIVPGYQTLPRFIAGHSLGSTAAQQESNANHERYIGAISLGASLHRVYNSSFLIPILSVNAELDGLQRVSRVGEAFFNRFDRSKVEIDEDSVSEHPIVIVNGINHLQFADGIHPSKTVKNLDLAADVPIKKAHKDVAQVISDFMCIHHSVGCSPEESVSRLISNVTATREFLDPMLEAFRLEAAPYLYHSCNSDTPAAHCPFYPAWPLQESRKAGTEGDDCVCGMPFAEIASKVHYNLDPELYPLVSLDAIHDVRDTEPFHHAHIWNNCSGLATPCIMNHTTVSEPMYEDDKYDSGFPSATAYEIRLKMKSRQVFALNSIDTNADFKEYDKESSCKEINEHTYKWALSTASDKARERYEKYGQKLVMTEDVEPILPIGPLFINSKLKYKEVEENGVYTLEITSMAFKTPNDGFVTKLYPDSNGYHYCKLLSPARAMEWIYTDGLRKLKGI